MAPIYYAGDEHGKKLALLFSIRAKGQPQIMVIIDPDMCSGTNNKSLRALLGNQLPYPIALEISDLAMR